MRLVLLLVIISAVCSMGADQNESPQKFKAILKTGDKLVVQNGILTDTSLIGTQESNASQADIPKKNMAALYRAEGKNIGRGVLIGSIFGFSGAALGCLWGGVINPPKTYQLNDDYTRLEERSTPITAPEFITIVGISTAAGAGIGLVVGLCSTKWIKVPLTVAVDPGNWKNLQVSYTTNF